MTAQTATRPPGRTRRRRLVSFVAALLMVPIMVFTGPATANANPVVLVPIASGALGATGGATVGAGAVACAATIVCGAVAIVAAGVLIGGSYYYWNHYQKNGDAQGTVGGGTTNSQMTTTSKDAVRSGSEVILTWSGTRNVKCNNISPDGNARATIQRKGQPANTYSIAPKTGNGVSGAMSYEFISSGYGQGWNSNEPSSAQSNPVISAAISCPWTSQTLVSYTAPTNADPTRVVDRVDECVKRDGTVTTRTTTSAPYTHDTAPAEGIRLPDTPCLAGETPASTDISERRTDQPTPVGGGTHLLDTPTVAEMPSIADPANACGAAQGWACETSPWVKPTGSDTWLQCGAQIACPNLEPIPSPRPGENPQTGTDPGGNPWQCRQGGGVVSLNQCAPLLDQPTVTDRETDVNGNPRTTPREPLVPRYEPKPPTPGTGGTPIAPPIRDFWECAPSGWQLLNPVAYVYGSACVLTWAFVPTPAGLAPLTTIGGTLITKPPFSWGIGTIGWLGALASPSCAPDCSIDLSMPIGHGAAIPLIVNECPPGAVTASQCTPGSPFVDILVQHRSLLVLVIAAGVYIPVASTVISKLWPTGS